MTTKQYHNHARAAVGFAALAFSCVAMADGYEDAVIATDDDSVRAIVLPTRFVYAFTNTSGSVTVTLKDAECVNRTLVVAGGGAGGYGVSGGGGGGGVLASDTVRELAANSTITLSVGVGGGAAFSNDGPSTNGANSVLTILAATQTAIGGGKGGSYKDSEEFAKGGAGGSGGGSTVKNTYAGGSGTTGQGHDGAKWKSTKPGPGAGGGASTAATDHEAETGSTGGEGLASDITGVVCVYGSGGGNGGGTANSTAYVAGKGGTNAGDGGTFIGKDNAGNVVGGDGVDGTGGGGGGASGNGGSGIVVLGFAPTTEGIITVASNMDVPDTSLPNTGYGSILTKTNLTVSVVETIEAGGALKYVCKGYALETWDASLQSWGSATTNSTESYSFSDVAGKCVRITWLWEKQLGDDVVFSDRAIQSTLPCSKIKMGENDFVYVFTDTSKSGAVMLLADAVVTQALVVAGGGGGGFAIGGGGGGGGVIYEDDLKLALQSGDAFTLTVGVGGQGAASNVGPATNGCDSALWFASTNLVAIGGGKGGSWKQEYATGSNGGSGGGSTYSNAYDAGNGTEGQGYAGGKARNSGPGGGGGATEAGGQKIQDGIVAGAGGAGLTCTITGTAQVYGSGGGAGGGKNNTITTELTPGTGGTNAGDGGGYSAVNGFGGGGGGGSANQAGGNGGSGTVILRLLTNLKPFGLTIVFR